MLLANRAAFSSKDVVFHLLSKQNKSQMLHPISYGVICKRVEAEDPQNNYRRQSLRSIHVTKVNKDVEAGLKALGAGVAATGVIGPGIGIGVIFGNFLSAVGRNPSVSNSLLLPAFLGTSFCEALGLLAIIISFVLGL